MPMTVCPSCLKVWHHCTIAQCILVVGQCILVVTQCILVSTQCILVVAQCILVAALCIPTKSRFCIDFLYILIRTAARSPRLLRSN